MSSLTGLVTLLLHSIDMTASASEPVPPGCCEFDVWYEAMHSIAQCPSPIHMAPIHMAPPPQGGHISSHGASGEFDMLQHAYVEFAGALRDPCGQSNKARLGHLSDQLQARGVYGDNALHLLQEYGNQINWQGMSQEVFSSFYRFVYFICREPSKRNVQVATAVAAWQLVLCGRFRLLERWCSYVSTHHKANVVLEDTWRQVLDFSRTVHEDLSNYDPASAWPVLLDEFVEHIKDSRPHRPLQLSREPLDILSPWAARTITAVSPRSGSKRRPPDVLEVADQLQQLPLAEAGSASSGAAVGHGMPMSPASQRTMLTVKRVRFSGQEQQQDSSALHGSNSSRHVAGGDAAMQSRRSSDDAMQGDATMMAGAVQQQQQQGAPAMQGGVQLHAGGSRSSTASGTWPSVLSTAAGIGGQLPSAVFPTGGVAGDISGIRSSGRRAVGAPAGGRAPQYGQTAATSQFGSQQQQAQQQAGGAGDFCSSSSTGAMGPPAPVGQDRLPGVQSATMPAPAGLAFRETGLSDVVAAAGLAGQQQLQGLRMAMSTSAYRTSSSSLDVLMDASSSEQPSQQQLSAAMAGQHQQQQHMASHPPLCPSGPHGHVRSEAEMRRTSSVIAMMQVTVTEALGFN